jgi:hypothetical protein
MKSIRHLSKEEQEHYILCDCGEYVDMRNLSEVFRHLHAGLPEPEWSYSRKAGEAKMYTKGKDEVHLN